MNKKTTLVLLAVLIALVGAYFAFVHQWHGPDNEFHITDSKAVGKIEIEKMEMNAAQAKVTLTVDTANAWTVNGQYPASEGKMKDFLKTLTEIRVLEPVDAKGQGTALSLLKRNHMRVRIWDRDGRELKDYLIGATNSTQTANIFKMGFSDKCYLVSKPALEGYVSVYYSTEVIDWREKLVWKVMGNELTSISVTYAPDSANQSYALRKSGSEWVFEEGIKAEPNRVGGYVNMFDGKLYAESFAGVHFPTMMDSLARRTPEARIRLRTTDNRDIDLLLFLRPENANSFFAYLADKKELMTVQHFVVDKFLKTKGYFMPTIVE
jgi:hypothetical protein